MLVFMVYSKAGSMSLLRVKNVCRAYFSVTGKDLTLSILFWLDFYVKFSHELSTISSPLKYLFQYIYNIAVLALQLVIFHYFCFLIIFIRMSYIVEQMALERGSQSRQGIRKKLIEQAFKVSQHRHYRMPRAMQQGQKQSVEDIPDIYNLYTQNQSNKQPNLLPLRQLIQLNSKFQVNSTSVNKKGIMMQCDNQGSREECRKSRIHRTLSKNSSRMQVKQMARKSWWCCIKEQKMQQLQTKQLTISDDWRYSKLLSSILIDKNKSNKPRMEFD